MYKMANPYNPGYYPTDYNMQSIPQNNIGRPTYYSGSINNSQYYGQQNSLLGSPMQTSQSNPILSVGQYGQPIQQQQPFQNLDTNLYIVPVTCPEEAVAYKIPLDGSITYFIDVSHNRIYSKQLNFNDGSCLFKTYVLETPTQQQAQQNPAPVPAPVSSPAAEQHQQHQTKDYVERQEFDQLQLLVNQLLDKKTDKPDKAEPADTQTVKTSKGGK